MKSNKTEVSCLICGKIEFVGMQRSKNYKACSISCYSIYVKQQAPNKYRCSFCNKEHYKKPSEVKKAKNGVFCSVTCFASWKSNNLFGAKNPNFRNRIYDSDGSRLIHSETFGRKKMHHAVVFEILGINKLPPNHCVHHRDGNHLNNAPQNLLVVSFSDHRWIHAQYGSAMLMAYSRGLITSTEMVSWSNDEDRALRLISSNVLIQKSLQDLLSGKLMPIPQVAFVEVAELSSSDRGEGGFGSSGK